MSTLSFSLDLFSFEAAVWRERHLPISPTLSLVSGFVHYSIKITQYFLLDSNMGAAARRLDLHWKSYANKCPVCAPLDVVNVQTRCVMWDSRCSVLRDVLFHARHECLNPSHDVIVVGHSIISHSTWVFGGVMKRVVRHSPIFRSIGKFPRRVVGNFKTNCPFFFIVIHTEICLK